MKKFLTKLTLSIGVCLFALGTNAQLISDFSNVSLSSKTWGTGTINAGNLPSGFQQFDLDGNSVNSQIAAVFASSPGWATVEVGSGSNTDTMALSTSWYNPAGQSNDVMICPPVSVPAGSGNYLTWEAIALDEDYPDGYQVYISSNPTPSNPGTLVYTTIGENATLTAHAIDVSNYAGQTIYITFVNNSNDMFLLLVDDIAIQQFNQNDVELARVSMPRYEVINKDIDVKGTIVNQGVPVNSLEISWNDGSGPQYATIGGLNIQPLQTYEFTHSIPFNGNMSKEYTVDVEITKVNGAADANASDNQADRLISLVSKNVTKYPLIEEGTGTWCGWCPRGDVAMKYMYDNYNDFVGIAVHNGDPMTVTEYDDGADISGFPGCNADRALLGAPVSTASFTQIYTALKTLVPPVDLSKSSFSQVGSTIKANVNAEFVTEMSDEIRLAAIIVEDGVKGTSSGYDQTNYYANNAQGPMGGYESLPNPVPASAMQYNHVGRALLGGYDGQAGSVTSPTSDGSVSTYSFEYTAPAGIDPTKVSVAFLAIHAASGQVLNAYISDTPNSTEFLGSDDINLELFPSPASEYLNISYDLNKDAKITLYDLQGKLIKSVDVANNNGNYKMDVSELNAGNYMISVSTKEASYIKVFTKK